MNLTNLESLLALGGDSPRLVAGLVLLAIWSLIWKGLALWHSAHRDQKTWFIVLLVLNTAGILEIIYLFAVAKIQKSKNE